MNLKDKKHEKEKLWIIRLMPLPEILRRAPV